MAMQVPIPLGASGSATAVQVIPSGLVKRPSTGWLQTIRAFISAKVTQPAVVNVLRAVLVTPRYRLAPA
jgi:hypothetical protein